MGMKQTYEAIAKIGTYKDKDGNDKGRYLKIGTVLTRDDGSMCLKLEAVPVGPGFTGWVDFRTPRPRDGAQTPPAAAPTEAAPGESLPY